MKKITSRWVSHQLTDEQRQERVKLCRENLTKFRNDSWRLCGIITGDETWIYHKQMGHKSTNASWVNEGKSPTTIVRRKSCSDNPMEWTRDDVALWLCQCNLEKLIPAFQENDIDGLILLSDEFDQNEKFDINSSSRIDTKPHSQRNEKSYSHRFLYISNETLQQSGVSYMNKLPRIQYTAWDRTVAWLYTLSNFSTVWLIEQDVQWYHPNNMTKLFNLFISNEADILCTNIVSRTNSWNHWPTTKSDIFPDIYWTGSFSPLVRWSYRLIRSHYQYVRLIHQNRLQKQFDIDFRFQEFIFATIAKMENFTLDVYNNYHFLQIGLNIYNDDDIIQRILKDKYILHRVKHDSILTRYTPNKLARIIRRNYTKQN
ncbi:unnamed protein product [Rotaria sordida]|uniref:Uncharacterized protein n=1 Tax=Rotaria sordida TaxID=392033 RepID=A0A819QNL2_9BILA|nr:unnamed protein product [Rotaria sordida]